MDARVTVMTSKIDGYMGRMEERDKLSEERFANVNQSLTQIRADLHNTNSAIGSLKSTVITTAIAAVLAIVFGIAAFNATLLSNMVASFESGRNTATAVGEATKRLEDLQTRIEAQQKLMTATPTAK